MVKVWSTQININYFFIICGLKCTAHLLKAVLHLIFSVRYILFFFIIILLYSGTETEIYSSDYGIIYKNENGYTHILNPLFQKFDLQNEIRYPFFRKTECDSEKRIEVLYPFYYSINRPDCDERQLFGIFNFTNYKNHPDGRTDKDYSFVPLIFWGIDDREGTYFVFLPVYGNLYDKFGKDEISFFLFPLYMKTRYKDEVIHNYLFPLIASGGDSKSEILRIFPFYYRKKTEKLFEKSIMWPFFSRSEEIVSKDNRKTLRSLRIFPFYADEQRRDGDYRSYLYPLIKFKRGGLSEYFAILPFFERINFPEYKKFSALLLYNKIITPNYRQTFFLYPFIKEFSNKENTEKSFCFLPFYKYVKKKETVKWQLFPLIKYSGTGKGIEKKFELNVLALDLFLDETSIEKNYARFWRLMNYYKKNDGYKLELLFNLMGFEKKDNKFRITVFRR